MRVSTFLLVSLLLSGTPGHAQAPEAQTPPAGGRPAAAGQEGASAQQGPRQPPVSCLAPDDSPLEPGTLFLRTFGRSKSAQDAPDPERSGLSEPVSDDRTASRGGWLLRPRSQAGVSGRHFEVLLQRPLGGSQRQDWQSIELIAAARPSDGDAFRRQPEGVLARFVVGDNNQVREEAGHAVLRVYMPQLDAFWRVPASINPFETWEFVIALCNSGKIQMLGWGDYTVTTGSPWLIAIGTTVVLLLLVMLTLAASIIVNRQMLDRVWRASPESEGRPEAPLLWKLRRMLSPAALTQTAEGEASLGRFQIFFFTLVVVGVLLVVFFSTFSIPVLSGDILTLLGITALGSFGARMTGNAGSVSVANGSWLTAKGIVERRQTLPRFTDLVIADGEVDLTRVQALFFTVLVGSSLVFSGAADLAGFTVPAQTMQLLGLSQIFYVAGKAIPAEGVKRLNAEVDALRAAERQVIELHARRAALAETAAPASPERLAEEVRTREGEAQATTRLTDACAAAEVTLESIYGARFRPERLRAIRG